ncbi:sensor histidine kinase [Muricomes sp. OA1]|nr:MULTISPECIES: sensor histidine kinase [Clostridia]MCH1975046.1 sensor histidine kinase [Muricomes sp. OA1]GKH33875.1 two-component sensor histidine kinase [Faecalicatena contorta]
MNYTQKKLKELNQDLTRIMADGSDEKVMIFTDDKVLAELADLINRLLEDRRTLKADYRCQENASRKMLSNISHDIKTPLTVILGYLEIMRMDSPDEEMLKKVEDKAGQVLEMMNQFFTLAKLEAGDTELEAVQIPVNEVCRESILDFYEILSQKGFEVDINVPEKAVYVLGDREALHRILCNLVSNAVRYGGDGNYIGLSIRYEQEWVYIDVRDRGKGIDKVFADSVFDRLFTMEDSRSRRIQGNGLGLTIARNLAKQMGGDIILQSEPFAETTFTVKLKRF